MGRKMNLLACISCYDYPCICGYEHWKHSKALTDEQAYPIWRAWEKSRVKLRGIWWLIDWLRGTP